MDFNNIINDNYYKIGNVLGVYCGFLVFFSALYLIFFRKDFSYFYILLFVAAIAFIYFSSNFLFKRSSAKWVY